MRQLVLTEKFKRAYRKFVRRDRKLQGRIEEVLRQMQTNVFAPHLAAHKLGGKLYGLWACSCGYDCRLIFSIEIDQKTEREVIVLLDIGTHDEVY
jgi:addiction module RelE/StbE family toxin